MYSLRPNSFKSVRAITKAIEASIQGKPNANATSLRGLSGTNRLRFFEGGNPEEES